MSDNQLKILSAGAPKTAVAGCAEAFSRSTGVPVAVEFATAPALHRIAVSGAGSADIVIAPVQTVAAFDAQGCTVVGSGSVLGSIKTAVAVRNGAAEPDLSSAETLKQAILSADLLVYNTASSGRFIDKMIEKLGIAEAVAAKITRTETGAAVLELLQASRLRSAIGFGQTTEIQVQIDRGLNVKLVGLLPKEVENVTAYRSALTARAAGKGDARALLEFIASGAGRRICRAKGLK